MMVTLTERVLAALDDVQDPCSIATRRPLSIVELGLVVAVQADVDGEVQIGLRATSPSCTLIASIMEAAEERVGDVPGVSSVAVELETDTVWSPDLMTPGGREKLETARLRAREELASRSRSGAVSAAAS